MNHLLDRDELPKAFIFDFDGTLCDVRGILQFIDRSDKHLVAFHEATHTAPQIELVFYLLERVIAAGITPLLLSARGERWRTVTVEWLEQRSFTPEIFYMRDDEDLRTGAEVKRDILQGLLREWNIVGAVDDDPKVVEMWESEGIPTIHIPGYNGTDDPNGAVIPEWWETTVTISVSA